MTDQVTREHLQNDVSMNQAGCGECCTSIVCHSAAHETYLFDGPSNVLLHGQKRNPQNRSPSIYPLFYP
ncbi:unnamed protein product [Schistosoma mattheei]|uniref:Uncharacterized protein n=1 Tax=Schistosoma mattheei TaxID=31246 RepID=A0A3P8ENL7_9TREM|nr:unnamed protein product [Schistosoma mattheei]